MAPKRALEWAASRPMAVNASTAPVSTPGRTTNRQSATTAKGVSTMPSANGSSPLDTDSYAPVVAPAATRAAQPANTARPPS